MTRKSLVLAIATALASLLAACAGASGGTPEGALTVAASQLRFTPETVEVVAGQPVTLVLTNSDSLEHDFSVMEIPLEGEAEAHGAEHDMSGMAEEPALHVAAQGGQSGALEFTPTQPGRYEFICTVPGHKEAGMRGTLVVRER